MKKIDGNKGRRGQILPLVLLAMTGLLGMVAMVTDVGVAYSAYSQLQSSTNAAALAGAYYLPNSTAATNAATYGAASGDKNYNSGLTGVTITATPKCFTSLSSIPCVAPATANGIIVKQTVSVPTIFAKVFGAGSISMSATATAAMRGASQGPFNVAIIVDTTSSMTQTDHDSNCNNTRISCALAGVQVFLQDLTPCAANLTTCGAATSSSMPPTCLATTCVGSNIPNPVDSVSLFAFPAVQTSPTNTVPYDYNCGGKSPLTAKYGNPLVNSTYQVIGFSTDYRTADTATTLVSTSNVVRAAGGKSGCTGLQAIGGAGTFYAGIINVAQTALVAAQTANPISQNVLILLSDGDANATSADLPGPNPYSTSAECQQAVTAATNAKTAGTRVYAVAYGAEASGCTSGDTLTPCTTMKAIATSAATFFSDYTATGGDTSCTSTARPTTNLNQIFTEIAGDLTVSRLIPNGTQ